MKIGTFSLHHNGLVMEILLISATATSHESVLCAIENSRYSAEEFPPSLSESRSESKFKV